jgi:hypothetical protein
MPPPAPDEVLELALVLDAEVVVELVVLGSPPAPVVVELDAEVVTPVVAVVLGSPPAPVVEDVVAFVVPGSSAPAPPLPSTMFVPSAQAAPTTIRVKGSRAKRRDCDDVTRAS